MASFFVLFVSSFSPLCWPVRASWWSLPLPHIHSKKKRNDGGQANQRTEMFVVVPCLGRSIWSEASRKIDNGNQAKAVRKMEKEEIVDDRKEFKYAPCSENRRGVICEKLEK